MCLQLLARGQMMCAGLRGVTADIGRMHTRQHARMQVYLCERCGWAHVCGDACTEDATSGASELRVCPISGRCFDKLVVDWGEARSSRGCPGVACCIAAHLLQQLASSNCVDN